MLAGKANKGNYDSYVLIYKYKGPPAQMLTCIQGGIIKGRKGRNRCELRKRKEKKEWKKRKTKYNKIYIFISL